WGRAKGRVFRQLDALCPHPRRHDLPQARLVQRRTGTGGIVTPEIQAADQHGVIQQIHHGARAEGGDDLAESNLPRRGLLRGALALEFAHLLSKGPSLVFSHRCAVSSTSRMDVGARKRPSGLIGSGALTSRDVCRSGGPLVFSLSKRE